MGQTPTFALPYPELTDTADANRDFHNLATATENALLTLAVVPIGALIDWPYASGGIPGWALLPYGQAISRATYAALHTLAQAAGYPHGAGDGSSTFTLPDLRGRVAAGKDDMGGTAAGRITAAISGTAGTVLGAVVGSEGVALTTAQLPAHNHPVTGTPGLSGAVSNGTLGVNAGSLALPQHGHSVGEGNHGHNIADAGHAHSLPSGQFFGTAGGAFGNVTLSGGTTLYTASGTTANGTGIGVVANAATGVSVGGVTSFPGISGAPALSGAISNGSLAATLGTLNTSSVGNSPADRHMTAQPTIIVNKFMRVR
jgi:microcystin-dependent protein